MLIDVYKDYLKDKASPGTIGTYARALEKILESGYSEADLLGSVSQLIKEYRDNPGKKNRRNTVAALKWLRRYRYRDYVDTFFIYHMVPSGTFSLKDVHMTQYKITAHYIETVYSNYTSKRKKLQEEDLYSLFDLLRYEACSLVESPYDIQPPEAFDYFPGHYDYCFGDKSAHHVESLFANSKTAVAAFNTWVSRVVYRA